MFGIRLSRHQKVERHTNFQGSVIYCQIDATIPINLWPIYSIINANKFLIKRTAKKIDAKRQCLFKVSKLGFIYCFMMRAA